MTFSAISAVSGMTLPSSCFGAPARSRIVGAMSVWLVTTSIFLLAAMPGPRMASGMWMSVSEHCKVSHRKTPAVGWS